jgi:ceramide glucosyltransferase
LSWFDWLCLGLAPIAVCLGTLPILLASRFRRYVSRELARPLTGYTPKVSVILPCKGLDPGFEENIQAIFDQDYPDFEIIFTLAMDNDEACPVLRKLIGQNPRVPAKLVHAGISEERGQKVNNQLRALREVRACTEVLVFVDSDGHPDRQFIRHLVDPLADKAIGATTGFRWYVPIEGGFGSWLRSTWNAGGILFLTHPKYNYAWGGAMAIRRETFDAADIASVWQHSISDDMGLTHALREREMPIRFVPQCLVASEEDSATRDTLEWTNRQTIIARVYTKDFWAMSALTYGMAVAFFAFGLYGILTHGVRLVSLACLLPLSAGMLTSPFILSAALQMLKGRPREVVRRGVPTCLAIAPAAALLFVVNLVVSVFRSQITWRGITYRLHDRGHITVVRS